MPSIQFNIRIPQLTDEQIATLCEETGLTKTQLVILAIDRLYRSSHQDDTPITEPPLQE